MVGDRGLEPLTSPVCWKRRGKAKMQNMNDMPGKEFVLETFWISIEFDMFRYVSIFLTRVGHKMGTTIIDNEHGEL